jgi:hypothetical protein
MPPRARGTHRNSPRPESREPGGTWQPDCGKYGYLTRKIAKRTAKRLFPGISMSVYECVGHWHYGNLPPTVKRGEVGREVLPDPRRQLEVS